ncbi:NAD-dependent epimerase [Pseudomonas alabamensis]|uniref:NAD-dependent epimerase n=1 Tax=Pseudomonas alabamensis TaxID=3064349 RepID=UPI0021DA06B1|nr:NAD-dependent epimerase [Pseudomonas entomophila]
MKVLITGAAGFIGMHVAAKMLARGDDVYGIDNLNDYYETSLKKDRLALLTTNKNFKFLELDVSDRHAMERLFKEEAFDGVIHLAAQAGVRYSLENPHAYIDSNIIGFMNILEGCRYNNVKHLAYASSSSVYGGNTKLPFSEEDGVDNPISIYAATKKSNELMAHTYSHLFNLPTTGYRFFTVYGPWGRPDMALFLFTKAILEGRPIKIFNHGVMKRDFTYIDDIVASVVSSFDAPPQIDEKSVPDSSSAIIKKAPYRILNIGNQRPVALMDFISAIEKSLGIEAEKIYLPLQDGDVLDTFADTSKLTKLINIRPDTPLELGVSKFVNWYKSYYNYL